MSVWAIVVAAGSGLRFGRPKQFEQVRGRSVLGRSVDAARSRCDGVVVVLPPDRPLPADVRAERTAPGGVTRIGVGPLGTRRGAGRRHRHRRARPRPVPWPAPRCSLRSSTPSSTAPTRWCPPSRSVTASGGSAGRPSTAVTWWRSRRPRASQRRCCAVRTPRTARPSDDATLAEAVGADVSVVPGEPTNVKLTHPADLRVAEALIDDAEPAPFPGAGPEVRGRRRRGPSYGSATASTSTPSARRRTAPWCWAASASPRGAGWPGTATPTPSPTQSSTRCWARQAWATSGSCSPTTTPAWRVPTASTCSATRSGWSERRAGSRPTCDCTVMTEAPRLAPRRADMERRLGDVVGAPVTVKGKRAEGLGTLGRREGLACWAVTLLTRTAPAPSAS